MLRELRNEVSQYLEHVAQIQSGILLSVVYLLIVAPISIVLRLKRRSLLDRGPGWRPARDGKPTLDTLRDPY